MSANIKISIALAAYNGSRYIAGQLQSLLDQTRIPDEIIICDDSADDLTYEAVKPFLGDQRVKYHKNASPLGVAGNFEKALSLTSGEIIFLCDQDDVWLPEKVDTLACALLNDPAVDGVFCDSSIVDENLLPQNRTLWQLRKFSDPMQKKVNRNRSLSVFLQRVTCSSHNIAFKRRALEYLLPFPELHPFYPDTFIALSIAAHSQWRAVPQQLTLYRLHNSNESVPQSSAFASGVRARSNRAALRNALLAETIIERAQAKLPPEVCCQLQKFALFHQKRDRYSKNFLLRTLQVLIQAIKLNYWRFANNLRTIAADVIIK